MKARHAPGLTREELEALPVHVLVRRWPEVLPELRAAGVDPAAEGADPLEPGDRSADAAALGDRLLAATAWRPAPSD